ncbi:MAG: hypothetical protein HC793_00725 [Aquincola sp.]|nr:hypothetical protein [Aquincola sp.]
MNFPVGTAWSGSNPNPAYAGIFIPEIWSGKLIEKFYKATVFSAIANTDYEGEIKNQGDTVKIRTRPTITIADYEANMDLAIQRPSSNLVELQIDKAKYFNLALDDVMDIQSDIQLMDIWAEDATEQMKISIDSEVLGYLSTTTDISSANRGLSAGAISGDLRLGDVGAPQFIAKAAESTGTGATDSTSQSVIDFLVNLGQVLDEQNLPESGRYVVIPAWMAAQIKKSELKDASLAGDGTSMLRNGRLGMVDRFTLYLSNNLPALGVYDDEFPIFFGVPAALTFAAQFTKLETVRSERSFSNLLRGLQVYGRKIVNDVAMGRAIVKKGD